MGHPFDQRLQNGLKVYASGIRYEARWRKVPFRVVARLLTNCRRGIQDYSPGAITTNREAG